MSKKTRTMKPDILSYLQTIDTAIRNKSDIPWNFKEALSNKVLSLTTNLVVPDAPSSLCLIYECNNKPEDGSEFCCDEHRAIHEERSSEPIRVRIIGNCWNGSTDPMKEFGLGCKTPDYKWNRIHLVDTEPYDYTVVINSPPPNTYLNKDRTIIFHMEPNMEISPQIWGEWSNPQGFLKVFKHSTDYNNLQWHMNRTYTQFMEELEAPPPQKEDKVSIIISGKYTDIGHVHRWNLATALSQSDIPIAFYGMNNRYNLPNHLGPLPHLTKDIGMYQYKYHIAIENNSNYNYVTEKIVDGILAECLTFYWGAPNTRQYIDKMAYIELDLSNIDNAINTIRKAIKEDWWSQRIQYIREAKKKIINELAFMPRLENYLLSIQPE